VAYNAYAREGIELDLGPHYWTGPRRTYRPAIAERDINTIGDSLLSIIIEDQQPNSPENGIHLS